MDFTDTGEVLSIDDLKSNMNRLRKEKSKRFLKLKELNKENQVVLPNNVFGENVIPANVSADRGLDYEYADIVSC